jgi:hypothetical protein
MRTGRRGCHARRTPLPCMRTRTAAAVLGVLPARPRSCAEDDCHHAPSRWPHGPVRFAGAVLASNIAAQAQPSGTARVATGGTERSWAADWVSVHTYRVYYGVGQRRPLWVGNAGVLTAFAALRARCVPEAGSGSQGTLSTPSTRSACGPPREPFSTSSGARAIAAFVCSHSFCGYGAPVFGASQFSGSFAPCGLELGYVSDGDRPALRLFVCLVRLVKPSCLSGCRCPVRT